jgi:hypothetical protein
MTGTESALKSFALRFSKSVCDRIFAHKTSITGPELLKLTPSGQINVLLVSYIQDYWKTETEAFRSPYFDYTHPEVLEALQAFRNVVSRHILLSNAVVEPLLQRATLEYLTWVVQFELWLPERIQQGGVPESRYTKTFSEGLSLIRSGTTTYLPSKQEKEQALAQLNQEFSTELPDWTPLTPNFLSAEVPVSTKPEEKYFAEPVFQQAAPAKSLIEKLSKENQKSLQQQVSLNQKLMFQKALFGNDKEAFQLALQALDTLSSFDAALDYLKTHFAEKYQWDFESDEVGELLELLENRYFM